MIVATALIALLTASREQGAAWSLLRLAGMGYAVPGSVIGVGVLIAIGAFDRLADGLAHAISGHGVGLVLGGTIGAVLYAYLVRFFAVGFNPLQAGMAKIAPALGDAARTLGCGPSGVTGRVHLPLLRPSLLSAALLVLVDVMKELPATMILRPFNFDTLAVRGLPARDDRAPGRRGPAVAGDRRRGAGAGRAALPDAGPTGGDGRLGRVSRMVAQTQVGPLAQAHPMRQRSDAYFQPQRSMILATSALFLA